MTSYPISELDAHWRAANYLAVGQIYLMDNPLLTEPLRPEHIKPRLLGHWGTSPGLNLVHTHLNRVIKGRSLDALCVWGPGHGGPAVLANSWLEGTYTETYPDITRDAAGMAKLFRQFSFPGGVPSHVAPETPGSIHEGGELGYALAHAYGAAFDHPGLLVACVIGDGEAETGPLAASWHSNKFLDPVHDGAVLPVLHLNGYKIANPTVLSRIPEDELDALLRGYGHDPLYVTGSDPAQVHHAMTRAVDHAVDRIALIQQEARTAGTGTQRERARWPMIVLRTPKGWTGPATVDGDPVEGTWRAHQVPLAGVRENPAHLKQLEDWLRSYRPQELFDADGRPTEQVLACLPQGDHRLGAVPYANGGRLLRPLPLPALDTYAVPVEKRGSSLHEPTRVLGHFLTQIMRDTDGRRDFRVVGPDETASNRLDDLYEATGKAWQGITEATDRNLSRDGRVME
ncbi:phosphoketolase family protein, partial [Streptomyces sp. MB09-01]|nr:phosphoketolase family protein [Streptomyces sp. MB09-01]